MRLAMQMDRDVERLSHQRWEVGVVGRAVDDRGRAAIEFVRQHCQSVLELDYRPESHDFLLNGVARTTRELGEEVDANTCLLEASTLGLVEIFAALRLRKRKNSSLPCSILYAEPAEYRRRRGHFAMHRRDFELSDEVRVFSAVPGASFLLREEAPVKVVLLLGYEGERFEQVLEQTGVRPADCAAVFGVPAFQAGWEMNSFANNVRIVRERGVPNVLFAGAQNPAAMMGVLERVMSTSPNRRLLLVPIGTKPHGVGAALYACENDNVGLVYDHPRRRTGRSSAVASWHLFDVQF